MLHTGGMDSREAAKRTRAAANEGNCRGSPRDAGHHLHRRGSGCRGAGMSLLYFAYKTAGAFLTLPGIFVFVLAAAGFFFRSGKEKESPASVFLFAFSAFMYLLSIPCTAGILLKPLEGHFSCSLPAPPGRTVVLVLGGGMMDLGEERGWALGAESLQRFAAGVRAAEKLDCPLIYSGGLPGRTGEGEIRDAVSAAAADMKFRNMLLVEGRSRTTWENLEMSSRLLRELGSEDVVLVTSAYHLPRSAWTARAFLPDMRIHPFPSGVLSESSPLTMGLLPSESAFRQVSAAVREYLGLTAYRLRGAVSF